MFLLLPVSQRAFAAGNKIIGSGVCANKRAPRSGDPATACPSYRPEWSRSASSVAMQESRKRMKSLPSRPGDATQWPQGEA